MPKGVVVGDQELLRLDNMATHLKVRSRYPESRFAAEIVAACVARVDNIIQGLRCRDGEDVVAALAEYFGVTFEEIRVASDVGRLEQKYLVDGGEVGFGRLRQEIRDPGVDALLFHRANAQSGDPDEFVAVLNLLDSDAKVYWNKSHELGHRVGEPKQKILPFRRHRLEKARPVEAIVDQIAAELAFYPPIFQPIVIAAAKVQPYLTFGVVRKIRQQFAPSASLQATMNAVTKHWPRPALAVVGTLRGRKANPERDRALRVDVHSSSSSASRSRFFVFPNMRVPPSSPMHLAHSAGTSCEGEDQFGRWVTSTHESLPDVTGYTSAKCVGVSTYGLLSLS